MPLPETPRFSFRLPADLRKELEEAAAAEHRKLTQLIIHVLREWLDNRRRGAG